MSEDDHLALDERCSSWKLPYTEVATFCACSSAGHVIVAGERDDGHWDIRAFDMKVIDFLQDSGVSVSHDVSKPNTLTSQINIFAHIFRAQIRRRP